MRSPPFALAVLCVWGRRDRADRFLTVVLLSVLLGCRRLLETRSLFSLTSKLRCFRWCAGSSRNAVRLLSATSVHLHRNLEQLRVSAPNVFFKIELGRQEVQKFLLVGVSDFLSARQPLSASGCPPDERFNTFAVFGPPRKFRSSRRPRQPEVGRNPLTG
jgi:hypothetical protein